MTTTDLKSLDWKTLTLASVLSGALGVGGGMFSDTNDVSETKFHDFEVQFQQLEARSEKRYKRGMETAEKLENRGEKLLEVVIFLQIENARLSQRLDDLENLNCK